MSELTNRYALPLLQVAQARKEVTHNEALAGIDSLLHLAVETAALASPPIAPLPGQAWIVGAAPSGVWAGRAGEVASFGSGGWRYALPQEGCVAWLRDLQRFSVFTAAGWTDDGWPAAGVRIGGRLALSGTAASVPLPVGGTIVDTEVRAGFATLVATLRGQGLVA